MGGDSTHVVNRNRLGGFLDGFKRAGITPDESLIHMNVSGMYMMDKIVKDLLAQRVDCIIGMDDSICNAILTNLVREGIKVPQDMKVAFDVAKLGMTACTALLELIDGNPVEPRTLMGYEVLMKESTQIM